MCPSPSLEWAASAQKADHGRDGKQHDGDEENELRDFDRGAGNAAETEHGRDERDDQECDCPTEHDVTSRVLKTGNADDARSTPSATVRFRPMLDVRSFGKAIHSERKSPAQYSPFTTKAAAARWNWIAGPHVFPEPWRLFQ
jgi:hypothetical protein